MWGPKKAMSAGDGGNRDMGIMFICMPVHHQLIQHNIVQVVGYTWGLWRGHFGVWIEGYARFVECL